MSIPLTQNTSSLHNIDRNLARKEEKLIKNKERQMSALDKFNKRKILQLQEKHNLEISKINAANQSEVLNKRIDQQKRLNALSQKNNILADKMNSEMTLLKNKTLVKKNILKNQKENEINEIYSSNKKELQNLKAMQEQEIKASKNKVQNDIKEIAAKNNDMLYYVSNAKNKILESRISKIKERQDKEEQIYRNNLQEQRSQHVRNIQTQKNKNDLEFKTRKNIAKEKLKNIANEQSRKLKQLDKGFNLKYAKLIKSHNQLISRLKMQIQNEISSMINDYSIRKNKLKNKRNDSFYNVNKLNPSVNFNPVKHVYTIKLPIQEYDKANLDISAYDKQINIKLSRRFENKFVQNNNLQNVQKEFSSQKTDVSSIKISLDHTVDEHQQIEKKYQDGEAIFKIFTYS